MAQSDRKVKCPQCETYFKRSEENFVFHKNRYWHEACFSSKEAASQHETKLLQYIKRLLHKNIDYKIRNQLNNYVNNKNYSYEDIYNALFYFYDIRGNSTEKANGGIGIVPYVIEEAKEYFDKKRATAAQSENIKPILEKRIITIKDPSIKEKNKVNNKIDIAEI